MTTALSPAPSSGKTDAGDDLDHYFCCDINRSLCGLDITDCDLYHFDEDAAGMCMVCDDLVDAPCANPDCPASDTG